MPRERRPPEVQKVFNHLNMARREVVKAVERFARMYDTTPPLPGHVIEMRRRLEAVRAEAQAFIDKYDKEN